MLDRRLRPVPIGVPGELCIGGVSLGRGYLNWPDLTAEKFIPDAFGPTPGMRLYRTGDLARFNEEGAIEFLGRIDDQVKVRGFRIELGEIETVLAEHPDVRTALILVNEDSANDKRLIAYIVPQEQATNGDAEKYSYELTSRLAQHLREKLPAYMVPSAFVLLKEMPLSPNGKLNRRLLPAPDENGLIASETYVAPRTAIEQTVADIFKRVLKLEEAGIHDNFFELGGHSLLATQVVSQIREQFDLEVSLRSFFGAPTVAGVAEIIEADPAVHSNTHDSQIKPASRLRSLPLSFAQQRLWFLDRLDSGSTAYNVPLAVRLSGSLNVEVLKRTLNEVVRRHEVLRTTLDEVDGEPRQIVSPPAPVSVLLLDLCELGKAEQEMALKRHLNEAMEQQFDLANGPLLKVELLKLADDEHVLILTMHHIITDGWSMGVLIDEVGASYEAFAAGLESPLPDLPIQYADYAIWQRERLQGEVMEQLLDYWRAQLGGAPSLELPTDHPRPARQSVRGARLAFELSAELTEKLRDLSQHEGVTLFMTLLSGWQTLLARYSGQWDISVGTPIANRTRSEV
ncbi:MAG TPA: condensation domain-containing protein, partial [Pyrinomonadaceae bacterium]